jgi:hypothetical protein
VGELERGLYEELVTERLRPVIDEVDADLLRIAKLDAAEAPDRIALHLARQVELALASLGDKRRVEVGIEVARALLASLTEMTDVDTDRPDPAAQVLRAVYGRRPDGTADEIVERSSRCWTRRCSPTHPTSRPSPDRSRPRSTPRSRSMW